jgi:hypothetical protein
MDAANKFWQTIGGKPVQFAQRLNKVASQPKNTKAEIPQ